MVESTIGLAYYYSVVAHSPKSSVGFWDGNKHLGYEIGNCALVLRSTKKQWLRLVILRKHPLSQSTSVAVKPAFRLIK